jgi:nitrous oxide reductase
MRKRPVTNRVSGTTLARLGEIYTRSLPGGFHCHGENNQRIHQSQDMKTYIHMHWHHAEQGDIFIVVRDQTPKVGLEPFLWLLSAKPGMLR